MKRTIVVSGLWLMSLCGPVLAQETPKPPADRAQVNPATGVAEQIARAERGARSVQLELSGRGRMQGGFEVTTRGELRVLSRTQAEAPEKAAAPRLYSRLEYSFGEGMTGRLESAQTAAGVLMLEDNPAFGAVLLRIPNAVVEDLEWAGRVLQRADLPGMADSRARSPLGSEMILELGRSFDFVVEAGRHEQLSGTWLRGKRKPGLDDQDPDLPLADRVELFVGSEPCAVRLVRHFVGEDLVQEIVVERLQLDVELPEAAFTVASGDLRAREVQSYQPMWEQIEQTLQRAEAKGKDGEVRPSKR